MRVANIATRPKVIADIVKVKEFACITLGIYCLPNLKNLHLRCQFNYARFDIKI